MDDVRLIDANAVLCFIKDEIDESKEEKNEARARDCESDAAYNSGEIQEARRIKRHILNAPTIDAVPVVHAMWIHDINNLYGCSACLGRETMSHKKLKKYCPNCGAKMDEPLP